MRVYVPTTLRGLAAAVQAGAFGPAPVLAFGVTPALREWYASGDAEELEYAAMTDAARECLRLLARDAAAPARRVVVAADVPDADRLLIPDRHPAAVLVQVELPLPWVASVHLDPEDVGTEVAAAAEAVEAADAGDEDAAFVVDGIEDHELHWYATQEIPHLLEP